MDAEDSQSPQDDSAKKHEFQALEYRAPEDDRPEVAARAWEIVKACIALSFAMGLVLITVQLAHELLTADRVERVNLACLVALAVLIWASTKCSWEYFSRRNRRK